MTKMVGVSLSLCLLDIINGKIAIEDVALIRASTAARDDFDWDKLITMYNRQYWKADQAVVNQIIQTLLADGRIDQPRLRDEDVMNLKIPNGWYTLSQYTALVLAN